MAQQHSRTDVQQQDKEKKGNKDAVHTGYRALGNRDRKEQAHRCPVGDVQTEEIFGTRLGRNRSTGSRFRRQGGAVYDSGGEGGNVAASIGRDIAGQPDSAIKTVSDDKIKN